MHLRYNGFMDEQNPENEKAAKKAFKPTAQAITLCVFFALIIATLAYAAVARGIKFLPARVLAALSQRKDVVELDASKVEPNAADPSNEKPGGVTPYDSAAATSTFTRTMVIIDDVEIGVLASLEAAHSLIDDILSHFDSMIVQSGESEAILLNALRFVPASGDAEPTNVDALFALLTGANSPIAIEVETTVVEYIYNIEDFKLTLVNDPFLPVGSRVVLDYGRLGETRTTITHVFANGLRVGGPKEQTIAVSRPKDRLMRVGTLALNPATTPDPFWGKQGKSADELIFIHPTEGEPHVFFGQHIDDAMHLGIDYQGGNDNDIAGDEVIASCGGTVVSAIIRGGYGLMVEIDHGNGFVTRYAHLDSVCVEIGDIVVQGQKIGEIGSSGKCEGTRLHFELRIDGEAYNPLLYIN